MFNAVELTWYRCRDGYRILEPTADELAAFEVALTEDRTMMSSMYSGPLEPVTRIIPVSDAREPYYAAGDLAKTSARNGISVTEAFLQTADNPDAILKFYDEFGPLRRPRQVRLGEWQHDPWYGPEWENGEPLPAWKLMRNNVTTLLNDIKDKSMMEAARIFDLNKLGITRLGMRKEGRSEKWRPILQPDSLSHLIWLELGLTVTGGAKIRPCQVCHKPMLIGGATGGKENRLTCSAKCRFSAYKQRKAKRSPDL